MNINMIRETLLNYRQNESENEERHPKANKSTDSDEECFADDPTDPDYVIRESVSHKSRMKYKHSTEYNTMNISAVAMVCERFGISDTAGAAISTARCFTISRFDKRRRLTTGN